MNVTRCTIAYIVSRFPKLTETFVLYELLEMQRQGVEVELYPLLSGRESTHQREVHALNGRVHHHPFVSLPLLRAHVHFIRRRPVAYVAVLAEIVRGTIGSLNFFVGAIGIFPKVVWFAYEMERRAVVHVHAQFANHPAVAALIVHRLTGVPFSFTARGSDIHVDRRMLKEKLCASAFAITVSAFNKQLMTHECGGELGEKVHVVYGGVDTRVLTPAPRNESDSMFRVLCVARFEEVKGHVHLVEACRLLRDRGETFECHLIGDGPLRRKIETQIARAGMSDRIISHGPRAYREIVEQLSRASVVVLATVHASNGKREGIPNVLKEAMACGLPVVGSTISGIPELVDDGRSGLLVPPGDSVALADALERLKRDPTLRRRMGEAGRAKIEEQFSLEKSTARRAALFLGASRPVTHGPSVSINSIPDSHIVGPDQRAPAPASDP
jgi:glycosyltransferase involved in cell wall biosynthesis